MGQTKSVVAELLQANYNFIVFLGIRYQHCCLQTKVDTFGNNSIYLFCSLIMCHYFNGLILFFVVSEKLTKIYGILEASSSKHRRASSILIKPPIVFAHACVHLSLRMSKFFFITQLHCEEETFVRPRWWLNRNNIVQIHLKLSCCTLHKKLYCS